MTDPSPLVRFRVGVQKTEVSASRADLIPFLRQQLQGVLKRRGQPEMTLSFLERTCRFPTGLLPLLMAKLDMRGLSYSFAEPSEKEGGWPVWIDDVANLIPRRLPDQAASSIGLRDYQRLAAIKLLRQGRGIAEIATGGGKSEIIAAILTGLACWLERHPLALLVLPPSRNLFEQTVTRLKRRGLRILPHTAIKTKSRVDPRSNPPRKGGIVISMIDTLRSLLDERSFLNDWPWDAFLMDEVHHANAATWRKCAQIVNAPRRFGFSATVFSSSSPHENYDDLELIGMFGPLAVRLPYSHLARTGFLPCPTVVFQDLRESAPLLNRNDSDWSRIEKYGVVENEIRNQLLCDVVAHGLRTDPENARFVFLVVKLEHGRNLLRICRSRGLGEGFFLHGQGPPETADGKSKALEADVLSGFRTGSFRILVGSVRFDEGQTFPPFSDLILCGGGRGGQNNRRLFQRLGRSLHQTSNSLRVWDVFDRHHPILENQARERLDALRREGFRAHVVTGKL